MNNAWWTARACLVASMVLGVFSVTTATRQHFAVVMLKSPLDVRLWMSRGAPTRTRRRKDSGFLPFGEVHEPEKYADLEDFDGLWLESSMSTLKAVALPRHLLDLSVVLFMVGIGLYELSGWKTNPNDPRGTAYRNVFIVFVATTLAYLIYHALILAGAAYDTKKKDDEFGTSSMRGAWGESRSLSDLRAALNKLHRDPPPEVRLASVLEGLSRELRESRLARQPGPAEELKL